MPLKVLVGSSLLLVYAFCYDLVLQAHTMFVVVSRNFICELYEHVLLNTKFLIWSFQILHYSSAKTLKQKFTCIFLVLFVSRKYKYELQKKKKDQQKKSAGGRIFHSFSSYLLVLVKCQEY